uniref:Uncharacterized protein n=1 Tax=Bombyx mori TaxID=7091 RepID=A0A8R2LVG5_BOMMO|nr:uncharacterized protein LOC119628543 [Bombyx mori]
MIPPSLLYHHLACHRSIVHPYNRDTAAFIHSAFSEIFSVTYYPAMERTSLLGLCHKPDVDTEAISSSICVISTVPAADVLAPSLIHSAALITLRCRHCLTRSYGVLLVPFDCC